LLQFIEGAGRATIKDLSGWTGRTGTSLYPHLEILEAAQLVAVEIEVGKGRPRRVYMPGPAVAWERQASETASEGHSSISLGVQLLSDLGLRLRRWGKARVKKAVEARDLRNAALVSETTWLDDQQLQEVNAKVNELMSFVREARAQRRGKRHNVAVYHFPDVTLREARDGVPE
jgi:predicted ArsR family transcriptional regulator